MLNINKGFFLNFIKKKVILIKYKIYLNINN